MTNHTHHSSSPEMMSLIRDHGTSKQRVIARFRADREDIRTQHITVARKRSPDAKLSLFGPFIDGDSKTGGFVPLSTIPVVEVPNEFARD